MGRPVGEVSALSLPATEGRAAEPRALDALADLRSRFDVVICEGAGSPAEINLRATDIANMGLARAADLPVVVVGDIDRGGVFAVDVRHARAAVSRRPGADRRVRREQVPRRAGAARARPGVADRADRPAGARRAALAAPICGSTPRTRSPLSARSAAGHGHRGRAGRAGSLRVGGDPAAADLQLHRRRRAGRRARRRGALRHRPGRAGRRRPGDHPGHPGHRGRPGLAARAPASTPR